MNPRAFIAGSRRPREREAELLICCATSVATPERTARARAIVRGGVDWKRTVRLASLQAVLPLVNRYLTSELEDALPAAAADGLRQAFFGNSVRNLHLARELARLAALLERSGVEALALKGPALAIAAYGSATMRQYTDLDLLVRESQAASAVEILRDAGYAPRAGYSLADLERAQGYEIAMERAGELAEIDLHWRLIPRYFSLGLDAEDLWRRATRVEIEGAAVRTLGAADHLLYLCAHGAKHGWQALGGICDLAELLRASSRASPGAEVSAAIDWDELRERAARARAGRALALGAMLAHELLDAPAPTAVLEVARHDPALVRAARSVIGYVGNPGESGPGFYQRWAVPLGVIAEARARLRYAAARAFLPSADDRDFVRLPRVLHPLYYLLRPLRVGLKESSAALRRLKHAAPSPADDSSR